MTGNKCNLDLVNINAYTNLVKFYQFVLKILSGNENLTSIKSYNCNKFVKNDKLHLSISMHIQNLVKFYHFVLKILSRNQIMTEGTRIVQSNVPLSEAVCRTHDSAQGHISRSWDLPFKFCVSSIPPEPFERFSLNFTQMFLSVRHYAESMTQLCRLKARVTLQCHGIYPSIFVSAPYLLNPLKDFH